MRLPQHGRGPRDRGYSARPPTLLATPASPAPTSRRKCRRGEASRIFHRALAACARGTLPRSCPPRHGIDGERTVAARALRERSPTCSCAFVWIRSSSLLGTDATPRGAATSRSATLRPERRTLCRRVSRAYLRAPSRCASSTLTEGRSSGPSTPRQTSAGSAWPRPIRTSFGLASSPRFCGYDGPQARPRPSVPGAH